jgi:hypothetical protein
MKGTKNGGKLWTGREPTIVAMGGAIAVLLLIPFNNTDCLLEMTGGSK